MAVVKYFFELYKNQLGSYFFIKGELTIILTKLFRITISVIETAVNMGPVFTTKRSATTPGTSRPTLFEKCLGSLTSHISLNVEGIGKRGLPFTVLNREALKV